MRGIPKRIVPGLVWLAIAVMVQAAPTTVPELHLALLKANPGYAGNAQTNTNERGEIIAVSLRGTQVRDLSPLKGLPLQGLDLAGVELADLSALQGMRLTVFYAEDSKVTDIGVLKGMPLKEVYLSNTAVADLSPLKGAKIRELNLVNSKVKDIGPLRDMPLQSLWLNGTPVADLSPLTGSPLVSLSIDDTKVTSVEPLRGSMVERISMARCKVKDLRPLVDLPLTRLVFAPQHVEFGMEALRGVRTLQELGIDFSKRLPPAQFWPRYETGEFGGEATK